MLTEQQEKALSAIEDWIQHRRKQCFVLSGLAGTGKTTVIGALNASRNDLEVLTPTGKAAAVLKAKGVPARTIHSAIYDLVGQDEDDRPLFERKGEDGIDFSGGILVVDEASMVQQRVLADLKALGMPLLFVGDGGQLEPVGDDAKILAEPDFELTEIHRQALQSDILKLAHSLREGDEPTVNWAPLFAERGEVAVVGSEANVYDLALEHDITLTMHNRLRVAINMRVREKLGKPKETPEEGDRVICLQNDWAVGVANGETFTVKRLDFSTRTPIGEIHTLRIVPDAGQEKEVRALGVQFNSERRTTVPFEALRGVNLFDYAYAITCHKSQGSEWQSVLVLDDHNQRTQPLWSPKRWRYTAATRARAKLTYRVAFDSRSSEKPRWLEKSETPW